MVESSSLIRLKVKDDDKVPCYSVLQQKGVDGAGQGFIGLIHRRTGSYFPAKGGAGGRAPVCVSFQTKQKDNRDNRDNRDK